MSFELTAIEGNYEKDRGAVGSLKDIGQAYNFKIHQGEGRQIKFMKSTEELDGDYKVFARGKMESRVQMGLRSSKGAFQELQVDYQDNIFASPPWVIEAGESSQ